MRLSPATRISFGLVALVISLLLIGKLLGIAPDQSKVILESRKNLSETLAIQFSAVAQQENMPEIKKTLQTLVNSDNGIKSAAMRNNEGTLLVEAGDHLNHWQLAADGSSTPSHVQIPLFKGEQKWATIEVSFTPLRVNNIFDGFKNSYLSLILFVGCAGYAGFFYLMKRTLRELDPSAVIPSRVLAAFNVLKEGVLILDEKEQIVLANESFAQLIGKSEDALIGYKGSELGWKGCKSPNHIDHLPWIQVLKGKQHSTGVRLIKEMVNRDAITLIVNAAPVLDNKGKQRGVLVTFDDVTELEEKNLELNQTIHKLQLSAEEVQIKNRELEFLATHDPLTLLLNRRAFNRDFKEAYSQAQQEDTPLSCLMADIDHFKSVNDRHGHVTGDQVIKMVANLLRKNSRENDLVGRYGGEEFCIILPGIDLKQAAIIGDRIRQAVKDNASTGINVTMSFGVSSLEFNATEPDELTSQADKALYIAKESGRNRLVCWGDEEMAAFQPKPQVAPDTPKPFKIVEQAKLSTPALSTNQDLKNDQEVQRLTSRLRELEVLAEKRYQELKHYTAYDIFTGLPNRTLFHDRVSQALVRGRRYDTIVAVLSISIDTIQRINETLGHESGENLFKAISKRLAKILREMDTVAQLPPSSLTPTVSRLGHEEIGILLTDVEEVNAVTWIVKRILNSFESPFQIDNNNVFASTNIGISIYPYDGETPEVLEKNATAAKSYAKKHLGINQYYFYSDTIHATSIKHLQLESKLHRAVKNNEFLLHYQPKVDLYSGDIIGLEALIRWDDPETGLVPPYEFIGIAEYSGLIVSIGDWVLETACSQVRSWLDQGLKTCSVAVNFSNRQFRQHNMAEKIQKVLNRYSLDPQYLIVEVTETSMMENIQNSKKLLQEISALGIKIALDDFGTGYSSLGYLKNFPVSYVKIDRSFIADIESNLKEATLVKSIINMAHGMGLKVTAEGVENRAQVELLQQYECDELQGYLFSKPIPVKEATKLLEDGISTYLPLLQRQVGVQDLTVTGDMMGSQPQV